MTITPIRKIYIGGLIVRLLVLIVISVFSGHLTTGYLRSNYDSDDLRYADGAMIYSQNADSIIDADAYSNAFLTFGDNTGYSESVALWYWMMCIMMYFFKNIFIVKIINVLFGVSCIILIYKLCKLVYPNNSKIALLSAKLYAFFPYPVFFCCFLYKDQFLTLVTLLIFYYMYKWDTVFKLHRIITISLLLLVFTLIRSGLLPILILCIGIVEYSKNSKTSFSASKKILILGLTLLISVLFYQVYYDVVSLKIQAYVQSRSDAGQVGNSIQYFFINDLYDIWKFPFSFMFSMIQPLYIGGKIINWEGVVSVLNFCSIPIIVMNIIYFFQKKSNNIFWIVIMILFMVMIVVSMGISRHFYYLLPFVFIFYSDSILNGSNQTITFKNSIVLVSFLLFFISLPIILIK